MVVGVCAIALLLLNAYALLLIGLRARLYGVRVYRPMLVNLALSLVPVGGAVLVFVFLFALVPVLVSLPGPLAAAAPVLEWAYLTVATGLWVLFFPNSIYLITELNLSHRGPDDTVPLWYDLVQTLALTLSGIANAVLGLGIVQTGFIVLVDDPAGGAGGPPSWSWWFAGAVILLGAVGVYLGRFLRFNSWDVRHPGSMLVKLREHFAHPGRAVDAIGFVVTHAVLVGLVYVPLYVAGYVAATMPAGT
ncbi:DUF1361 domain-containing protein [Agromyces sp. SYSU T0242]|uniref:DUF1361 domain-containing protein n=1 Tax=Agromyces litoreus TaxID=3158561 RepID=UPI003392C14F